MNIQRLRQYLPFLVSVWLHSRSLLLKIYTHFSECPITTLIILAIVFHLIARFMSEALRSPGVLRWGKGIGLLAILACCLHAYLTEQLYVDDLSECFTFGMRAFLAFFVVEGTVALVFAPFELFCRLLVVIFQQLGRATDRFFSLLAAIRLPRRQPRPISYPPPPTLQMLIDQTKQHYAAECESIRSAGLDEDESESALTLVRQKYLRRLHELMNR